MRASIAYVRLAVAAALGGGCALHSALAATALAPEWNVSGTLSNRLEYYGRDGDTSRALFPDGGEQFYSEANVNFSRRVSAYERISGNLFGLYNQSDYRSQDDAFSLERGQLRWEKGDAALPFRAEAGDFFGFFSPRTIQRTLKGGQLELQPRFGGRVRSSAVFFSGVTDPTYRGLEGDTRFSGASLFVGGQRLGSYTLNVVHNRDEAQPLTRQQEQTVASLAGEYQWRLARQALTLEGEVGLFDGDYALGAASDEDARDTGVFVRLAGRDATRPLSYSLTLERYGEDYRPKGAIIVANRSTVDANVGYVFAGGLNARLRAQRFEDALESSNATVSYVSGVNLSGRLPNPWIANLSLFSDTFVQVAESDDGVTDTRSLQTNLDLSAPLDRRWNARVGGLYRTLEDRFGNNDSWTGELRGSLDGALRLGRLGGRISPGVTLRRTASEQVDGLDVGPSLALNLGSSRHDLNLNYQALVQTRDTQGADLVTHNAGVAYAYRVGRHQVGVDALYNASRPDAAASSETYRVGAFYTFTFERPARPVRTAPAETPGQLDDPLSIVTRFGPGASLAQTRAALADIGITSAVQTPGSLLYDARVFDAVDQRQRIVVLSTANLVDRTAVIVDLDNTGRPETAARVFERVREALIRRLGTPQTSYAKGEFDGNFAAEVAAGRFTRVDEWITARGVLRLGIPQRLDGQVRIEIQQASQFPPAQRTLWSIESVR